MRVDSDATRVGARWIGNLFIQPRWVEWSIFTLRCALRELNVGENPLSFEAVCAPRADAVRCFAEERNTAVETCSVRIRQDSTEK